jgi:hypothetical protein
MRATKFLLQVHKDILQERETLESQRGTKVIASDPLLSGFCPARHPVSEFTIERLSTLSWRLCLETCLNCD